MNARTYTDAHIEHWGHVYETEGLAARGIRFEAFLAAPEEILATLVDLPEDAAPLLPRQAEAMALDCLGRAAACATVSARPEDAIEQITLGTPCRTRERRHQQELRQLVLAGSIMAEFLRAGGIDAGAQLAHTWETVLGRFRIALDGAGRPS